MGINDLIAAIPHQPDAVLQRDERSMRKRWREALTAAGLHLGAGAVSATIELMSTGGMDPGIISVTLTTIVIGHDAMCIADAVKYMKALRAEMERRGLKHLPLGLSGRAGKGSIKALAFGLGIGVLDGASEA